MVVGIGAVSCARLWLGYRVDEDGAHLAVNLEHGFQLLVVGNDFARGFKRGEKVA